MSEYDTENQPEPTHQDPAEPKEIDTEVETTDQPEPVDPAAVPDDVDAPQPAEPVAVPVEPAVQADANTPGPKTDTVHGKDYTVTDESGYRRS